MRASVPASLATASMTGSGYTRLNATTVPIQMNIQPRPARAPSTRVAATEGSTKSGAAGAATSGSGPSAEWTPSGRADMSSALNLQRRSAKVPFCFLRAFAGGFPASL